VKGIVPSPMLCTAANSDMPGFTLQNSAFNASDAITAPNSNWAICSISAVARSPLTECINSALAFVMPPLVPTNARNVSAM